uniref:SRCR domain-containing protein n=1 Tax=Setaria digitata TaxID=48799 RepID=A0A915PUQ6_9BILA
MLPYQQITDHDHQMPQFRLIDGSSVRQGRLQIKFRNRWRSICTKFTNWTSTDIATACRSMGFTDGDFWKWYQRNNDTYPFVMSAPKCSPNISTLWQCVGFNEPNRILLSENLCQGEDDIGIRCWGASRLFGYTKHWKGLQILSSAIQYATSDPDMVALHQESISKLEFVDILYAGYDGSTKNTTAAIWIEGIPPVMNGLRIEQSARDGIYLEKPNGPVIIANSTIRYNRGHGITIMNTTDGRVFINMTTIAGNYGDGIHYCQGYGAFWDLVTSGNQSETNYLLFENDEKPRLDMCTKHKISHTLFFPHLIQAKLLNGTIIDSSNPSPCWMIVSIPAELPYTYSIQFMAVINENDKNLDSKTQLIICDASANFNGCDGERYRIPIFDRILPQTISFRSARQPIYLSLEHIPNGLNGHVNGDINLIFRIHATATDKAFYGLNVSNAIIASNIGNGIWMQNIRDRVTLTNVTIVRNEGQAGFLVRDGAADIWINASRIDDNWGDGINVSYAGGSITINGTLISRNRMRGCAFNQNISSPYLSLRQEIIFKGRPSNNIYYLRTQIVDNAWGGILIGNFCISLWRNIQPKVLISWTELIGNRYHPSVEIFVCQKTGMSSTIVDFTGNRIEGGSGVGFRMEPAVNIIAVISSNQFIANNNTALIIRNIRFQHLYNLPAQVVISKNSFKFNTGQSIISIGMVEGSRIQNLTFNQQNEVRENRVINPFPYLNPRSTPYAALLVSSSNVIINRNCFKNPQATYEIGSELNEHAKWIDARENNWGFPRPELFMHRIFDQFNRYNLATIEVNPFAAVCNQRRPHITTVQQYYRLFRKDSEPFILGGTIWENQDLGKGLYTVVDDLNIVPGARLTLSPDTVLQFNNGLGMLVQGELVRTELHSSDEMVKFTSTPFILPHLSNIRLVDENDNSNVSVIAGRLEVYVNGQWGTICNRSWTQQLASLACNQLGLIMDPEHFENWHLTPLANELPMVMDNIRCEENEYDITRCRHDGTDHNIAISCPTTDVVGLRCMEPRWSGVRYSLLANPPLITGQSSMEKWIIENAGLFDFRLPAFSAALQIDWNCHTFHHLYIRNNFWNGIDVIYNDLTRKPTIRLSHFDNNRRHGFKLRSHGITIEKVSLTGSGQSGFRYDPLISNDLQRDIVTWLERRELPEMEANNVFIIPNMNIDKLTVYESHLNQRKFLIAKITSDCPLALLDPCVYEMSLFASGHEYGLNSRLAIQVINRVSDESDEDILLIDNIGKKHWSVRNDLISFPILSVSNMLKLKYTRTYGKPSVIILVLFLDAQTYLNRFVHIYQSEINNNQYAISSVHYSNWTTGNDKLLNRWANEKFWFQKVNFTGNKVAIIWIHSPQHIVFNNTPIAKIDYHIDNCSIVNNTGSIIQSHRDLYSSPNIFEWYFWSNTFANNINSTIIVHLPDTINFNPQHIHSFKMAENRFENNTNFAMSLNGYYASVNISSNNFTNNNSPNQNGLITLNGMEKDLFFERNRLIYNYGCWMLKMNIKSHSLRSSVAAWIQYNYFVQNYFLRNTDDYVDVWPRSFAIGIFGSQLADVHFNRLRNVLFDFELISGAKSAIATDTMNVTYNWWGSGSDATIYQRIFDFDDWNIFTLALFSPFYVTEENFISFWWKPQNGQLGIVKPSEQSIYNLNGRLYQSVNLTYNRERWHQFPFHFKPFQPYRIIKDLTIMPGVTLTIEKGVEVHVWPNVRILVLGNLKAEGTYWEPIRFKPINMTEYTEVNGAGASVIRHKRSGRLPPPLANSSWQYRKKRKTQIGIDNIYQLFPTLNRYHLYYQQFKLRLNGSKGSAGFLEYYNATTGEWIPSCDREFTIRNAQVVCRELGFHTGNIYEWLTPRWNYNPKINIRKSYVTPRECIGNELRLDQCPIRLSANLSMWQCIDNEHFNYIHCDNQTILNSNYIGNWGGITIAHADVDYEQINSATEESILRNVEVIGAGLAHNETIDIASILSVGRNPTFDHVNITNSSMHGLQILTPHSNIILNKLNVTHNRGYGISFWLSNLQGSGRSSVAVQGMMNIIPYNARGLLDICAAQKQFKIINRILLYYKYDSHAVDCVKTFIASEKSVGFRFLLINLYNGSRTNLGRTDSITLYSDAYFTEMVHQFTPQISDWSLNVQTQSLLAIHVRASAANGIYGFIAEITVIPASSQTNLADEILLRHSRIMENDRGAIIYRNTGEIGPNLVISNCMIMNNGYYLYGNITTANYAIQLHFHNTLLAQFRNNLLMDNIGGLQMTALTTSSIARLTVIVRECAFMHNSNATIFTFLGNGNQKLWLLNNLFRSNYAFYDDIVLLKGVTANLTRNLFANNIGLHIVDLQPNLPSSSDSYIFYRNWFHNNIALGHGHHYRERYGYQPDYLSEKLIQRSRRQIFPADGVSFDWWTHIGMESERYRSTVYVGTSNGLYRENIFNNPINPYELVTGKVNRLEGRVIDAKKNYWGYPGTIGVAGGKIRDYQDYNYLIGVDYVPVLESNTSLIEGDCPAGWFQVGVDEFKSCFLYSGAVATYNVAVKFCQEMDAFVPYLRVDESRQKEVAKRIDDILRMQIADSTDRYNTLTDNYDKQIWISGATVPVTHCGWLSTRTGNIGFQNCNNLLSFVCEKGVLSYDEPVLWRSGIIIAVIALSILFVIILLLAVCWFRKSRKRKEEEVSRKECIRASLRLSKLANEIKKNDSANRTATNMPAVGTLNGFELQTDDAIMNAHRNLVHGKADSWSSMITSAKISSGTSLVTSFIDQNFRYRPATAESTKTNSTVDSCSANSTESFTYRTPSSRNLVSQKPNPYAEVSLSVFNAYGSVHSHTGSSSNDRRNTDVSTCSTGTDTVTCSTCHDCSESTLTERSSWNDSSSAHSSIISDRTIQQLAKPLLNRSEQQTKIAPLTTTTAITTTTTTTTATTTTATGEDTVFLASKTSGPNPRSTYSKLIDLPPPPLFDPKLLENDKTNGKVPLKPIRTAPPPPPSHLSLDNEQFVVPLEIPTISSPPRRSMYETTTEFVENIPYNNNNNILSSYRTKIQSTNYQTNGNYQTSQSLVNLITPSNFQYQRSNSTGKTLPIETSM